MPEPDVGIDYIAVEFEGFEGEIDKRGRFEEGKGVEMEITGA